MEIKEFIFYPFPLEIFAAPRPRPTSVGAPAFPLWQANAAWLTDTHMLPLKKRKGRNTMSEETKIILEKLQKMEEKITQVQQELKQEITQVQEEVTKNRLILENDISRKIDVIGEGHDFLKMRLNDALSMDLKREAMELQIINLRMEVSKIKEKLDIAWSLPVPFPKQALTL